MSKQPALRITCIHKAVTEDAAGVTHVGGVDADGNRWKMSVEEACELIEAGEATFYIALEDQHALVSTRTDGQGARSLQIASEPDAKRLLRLPGCT